MTPSAGVDGVVITEPVDAVFAAPDLDGPNRAWL